MKKTTLPLLALLCASFSSCSTRPAPSLTQTYNGKPVLTQASHGAGGPTKAVDGVYLGRRYFNTGTKSGLAWIDVYGQR